MKICLINPPSPFLINDLVFPSLGVLYISAYLKNMVRAEYVEVVDLAGETPLPKIDAEIIGITSTTPQFPHVVQILKELKKMSAGSTYIIGGPHASCFPESCLEAGFDQVVVGEGERAMLKIAEGGRERIIQEPFIENLDEIPFPDRTAIDIRRYHYYLDGKLTTNMMTSRGCPYGCAFCCKAPWGRKARFRSPQNVFEEVELLKEMGFDGIMFFDDEFFLNRERDLKICKGLKDLEMVWRCFIRTNLVNREILKIMKDSGCIEVGIGIESGSDKTLKIINKGTTRDQNIKVVKMCREVGIRTKTFLIVGLPGETYETVEETKSFIREARPDDFDITIFTPYPKSDIYENKEKYDVKFTIDYSRAWYKGKPHEYQSLVRTSELTAEEITRLRDEIEQEFKA